MSDEYTIHCALTGITLDSSLFTISKVKGGWNVKWGTDFILPLANGMKLPVVDVPSGMFQQKEDILVEQLNNRPDMRLMLPAHPVETFRGQSVYDRLLFLKQLKDKSSHKGTFIRDYELCECSDKDFKCVEDVANSCGMVAVYMIVPKKNQFGRFLEEECQALVWDKCPRNIESVTATQEHCWLITSEHNTPILIEGITMVPIIAKHPEGS